MVKVKIFHANALEKLARIQEQVNTFLTTLKDDDFISINTNEMALGGNQNIYSFTVILTYKE